ncbi:MAG: hypothetical protein M0P01_03900 [Treponema sp.]|nr:hypothetical protein [Treponema sp.]
MKQRFFMVIASFLLLAAASAESWRIGDVQYRIDGRTTGQALSRTLKIDTIREFASPAELASYVQQLRGQLSSCRAFDETEIAETLSSPDGNGTVTDTLVISVHDTKNTVIVPYPSFSSNTGLSVKLKLKDYNFAGSLAPLSASLYYAPDDDTFDAVPDKRIGGDVSLVMPFTLGTKDAFITAGADATYALNRNSVLFSTGTQFEYYPVTFGTLNWGPYASVTGGRNDAYEAGGFEAAAAAGQKLSAQNVFWNGNFRSGYGISLIQTFNYDFIRAKPFFEFTVDAEQYKSSDHIGFAAREFFMYKADNELMRNAGSYLRGIRDRDIRTDLFVSLNMDMPFTLFTVQFPDTSAVSLLNCEVQCSPFVDAALGHNTVAGSYLNPKDGWYTFGIDVNVFPVRWRSLQIHGSFGVDAEKVLEKVTGSMAEDMFNTSWRTGPLFEISAGIGLFY